MADGLRERNAANGGSVALMDLLTGDYPTMKPGPRARLII